MQSKNWDSRLRLTRIRYQSAYCQWCILKKLSLCILKFSSILQKTLVNLQAIEAKHMNNPLILSFLSFKWGVPMVIVWFWRMLYVMACHVAMHTTLHGDTRVSDNVIPRHHHETKKEVACLPEQVVEEFFFFRIRDIPHFHYYERKYSRV